MNKYIPTMFKRIYTSMILALALSVSVTIILSNEYLERDAIVDFQRDTNYIYKKLSETWEREELSASEYFNNVGHPLPYQHFDVEWLDGDSDPVCIDCSFISNEKNTNIYLKENGSLLAVYQVAEHDGYLFISDRPPLIIDSETLRETPIYKDPEILVPITISVVALVVLAIILYYPTLQLQKQIEQIILVQDKFGKGYLDVRANENIPQPLKSVSINFNKMAREIDDTVSRSRIFAQAVPHEMRTPLSRIQLAVGILRKENNATLRNELLNNIDNYIEDMTELSDKVVLLSKINSGQGNEELKIIDINRFIQSRLQVLKNVDSVVDVIIEARGNTVLECNEVYLRLIIDNLINNAFKYANRKLLIKITSHNNSKCISFDNDGPPIPTCKEKVIFMPFARLDDSRSSKTGGLGLGLAIARSAAKGLGGSLAVSNSEIGGVNFILVI